MKLTINTDYLSGCSQTLATESSQLSQAAGSLNLSFSSSLSQYRVASTPLSLKYCKVQSGSLTGVLASYRKALNTYQTALQELSDSVAVAAKNMEETEARLTKSSLDNSADEGQNTLFPFSVPLITSEILNIYAISGGLENFTPEKIEELIEKIQKEGGLLEAAKSYISDISKELSSVLVENTSFHGEASASGVLGPQYGFTNEYGGGELVIGAYEGEASLDMGLFSLDENGNAYFNPAMHAAIGMSVTALQAHIAQEYNLVPGLSAGFSGNMTVGQLDANASANFGLFENGVFNPTAHVAANLQATAFEASAEGHINVAGIEGSVDAGVFVGAGAHFEAGYEDGVLSFDMGAGLGLGVNFSASLDVSGVVDTWNGIAEAAGDMFDTAGDIAGDMIDAASDYLESIFSWF